MDLIKYQKFVYEIFNPDIATNKTQAPVYLASKLTNELLELHEVLVEFAPEPDYQKMVDEAGDVMWYIGNLCNIYQLDLSQLMGIAQQNTQYASFDDMLKATNKLLSDILKNTYHGKPLAQDDINIMVINIIQTFNGWLTHNNIYVTDVITHNVNKLKDRHGKIYNNRVYTEAKS